MKEKALFFTLVLFILFSTPSINAEEISIIAPEKPLLIYAGRVNEVEVLIKNMGMKDTFYFSLWGDPARWTSMDKNWITLNSSESSSILLKIEPPRDAEKGTHVLSISVLSLSSNVSVTKEIYLDILRGSDVLLQEIKLEKQTFKPGETFSIQPVIVNLDKKASMNVSVSIQVLKGGLLVKKFEETLEIEPGTTKTLSHSFSVGKYQEPGEYTVKVIIRDSLNKLLDEGSTKFRVETIHRIDERKETKNSILYTDIIITVTNEGNVPERNFYITASMPVISKNFFFPEVEPTLQEEKGNRIVYRWLITELKPGERVVIKYQLRFTNVVLASSAIIVGVIWITWLVYRPSIKKDYIGFLAEKKEVTVSLNIKNKTRKVLRNIVVKDFIPAVASVIKKFDTLVPKIKKKSDGTELTWNIEQLKPNEERVLTYRIRPLLDIIGGLKLPKAYLVYETKKGKKKRVLSRGVTIRRRLE